MNTYEQVEKKVSQIIILTLSLETNQNTLKPLGLLNRSFSCPSQYQQKQKEEEELKKKNLLNIFRYNQTHQGKEQQQQYDTCEVEHIIYGLVQNSVEVKDLVKCMESECLRGVLKLKGLYLNHQLQAALAGKQFV